MSKPRPLLVLCSILLITTTLIAVLIAYQVYVDRLWLSGTPAFNVQFGVVLGVANLLAIWATLSRTRLGLRLSGFLVGLSVWLVILPKSFVESWTGNWFDFSPLVVANLTSLILLMMCVRTWQGHAIGNRKDFQGPSGNPGSGRQIYLGDSLTFVASTCVLLGILRTRIILPPEWWTDVDRWTLLLSVYFTLVASAAFWLAMGTSPFFLRLLALPAITLSYALFLAWRLGWPLASKSEGAAGFASAS